MIPLDLPFDRKIDASKFKPPELVHSTESIDRLRVWLGIASIEKFPCICKLSESADSETCQSKIFVPDEANVKGAETSRVEPGEIEVCAPSNVSSPLIGEIISETEPVASPEFVTIIEAMRVSPTYPGSPETANPEPPDDVKLVELVDSSEYIGCIGVGSVSCGEW
tara:strand:- start:1747 stop:2244 length:498 start_codon:yes stop_codon:yes gene_type:complete